MAQYEFQCQVCSMITYLERSIHDTLPRDPYCDNCVIPMKRIYSSTPIHFKGKGWGGDK